MNDRESEFAFITGQFVGMLHDPRIVIYLEKNQVTPHEIDAISVMLKDIAEKVFYGKRK